MNFKLTICLTAIAVSGWTYTIEGDASCDHPLSRLSVETKFETEELPGIDPNSFTCFEINVAEEISKRLKANMVLVGTSLNKVTPTILFDESYSLSPLMALKDPLLSKSNPLVGGFLSQSPTSIHTDPSYNDEETPLFSPSNDPHQYLVKSEKLSKPTRSNPGVYPLDEYEEEYIPALPKRSDIILYNINDVLEEMHFDGTLEILKHKWGV